MNVSVSTVLPGERELAKAADNTRVQLATNNREAGKNTQRASI